MHALPVSRLFHTSVIVQVTVQGESMIKDDFFFNQLPDVWRTGEPTIRMGEALNGLFADLEARELIGWEEGAPRNGTHTTRGMMIMHAATVLAVLRKHGAVIASVLLGVLLALILARLLLKNRPGEL